jgi:SAM-dependent methyltransferase
VDLSEVQSKTAARHPWEVARASAVEGILRRRRHPFESILDFGCGDGFLGEYLQGVFGIEHLVGVDHLFPESALGLQRGATGSIEHLRDGTLLGTRRFDLILLCDVIEHVADDLELVQRIRRDHLADGGLIMVTAPSFQWLFSGHDRALGHHRRYRLSGLRKILRQGGLVPLQDGYLFGSLVPVRMFVKVLENRVPAVHAQPYGVGGWRHGAALTGALVTALRFDNRVLVAARRLGVVLPGLSTWALCHAPRTHSAK